MEQFMDYILEQLQALLAIDSPSGFTAGAADYLLEEYRRLGFQPEKTKKGGVLVSLGGAGNAVLLMAHADTLGAVVAEIKPNGHLRIAPVGGLNANNIETENCRIRTLDGRCYDGTVQLTDASTHVNGDYQNTQRSFQSIEVLLDADADSRRRCGRSASPTARSSASNPAPASRNPAISKAVFWMISSAPPFCSAMQNT